jgi:hypothetical protein
VTAKPVPRAPSGLSPGARRVWQTLGAQYEFRHPEWLALEESLRWRDRAETWLKHSEQAAGREQAELVKRALDASQMGLRFWRLLKFVNSDEPLHRRPGRPGGREWSAARKAGATAHANFLKTRMR